MGELDKYLITDHNEVKKFPCWGLDMYEHRLVKIEWIGKFGTEEYYKAIEKYGFTVGYEESTLEQFRLDYDLEHGITPMAIGTIPIEGEEFHLFLWDEEVKGIRNLN